MNTFAEKFEAKLLLFIQSGFFLILLTPLIVFNDYYFPYVTSRNFIFRIVVETQSIFWLILLIKNKNFIPKLQWPLISLLIFIVCIAVSDFLSIDVYRSFWGNLERMDGMVNLLHLLAFFLIGVSVLKDKKIWNYLSLFSLGVALIVCLTGLKNLLSSPTILISSTLGNSTYLAIYLVFHFFILLHLMIRNFKINNKMFALSSAGMLILLVTLFNTGSRGSFLGLICGSVLVLILNKAVIKKVIIVFVSLALFSATGIWLLKDRSHTVGRLVNFQQASSTRLILWDISLKSIKEKPLLGWGQENFDFLYDRHYNTKLAPPVESFFDRSHNTILDWAVAGGLIGAIAYLFLFMATLITLWRGQLVKQEKALVTGMITAYFIHNLFIFDYLVSYLFFFLIMIYCSLNSKDFLEFKFRKHSVLAASLFMTVFMIYNLFFFNLDAMKSARDITLALSLNENKLSEAAYKKDVEVFTGNVFARREAADQLGVIVFAINNDSRISPDLKKHYIDDSLELLTPISFEGELYVKKSYSYISILTQLKNPDNDDFYRILSTSPKRHILYELKIKSYLYREKYPEAEKLAEINYNNDQSVQNAKIIYSLSALLNSNLGKSDELLKNVPLDLYAENLIFIDGYKKLGLKDRMVEHFKKAIIVNPERDSYHTQLGMLYQEQGKNSEAAEEFAIAQKLVQKNLLKF